MFIAFKGAAGFQDQSRPRDDITTWVEVNDATVAGPALRSE